MKDTRLPVIAVTAIVVAFGWSFLTAEPQTKLVPYPLPSQELASAWQQAAGETLGLRPALVERAMTEQEWGALQEKMRGMRPTERERYQREVQSRILKQVQG